MALHDGDDVQGRLQRDAEPRYLLGSPLEARAGDFVPAVAQGADEAQLLRSLDELGSELITPALDQLGAVDNLRLFLRERGCDRARELEDAGGRPADDVPPPSRNGAAQ